MKRLMILLGIALTIGVILAPLKSKAWSEHPLLAYPVLSSIPDLTNRNPVEAQSLKAFLIKEEKGLAEFLMRYEEWAKTNLPNYAPLPQGLEFKHTGNQSDIVYRFLTALRLNPNIKLRLYLHLLPNQDINGKTVIPPSELTTLTDVSSLSHTNYVVLNEGELVAPLQVLCTANDEPDYGFDIGLFEDNGTSYGKTYGFGVQPFGDPKLEYGSQAPFHMGFYHEAKLVYAFGPFLRKTYPEYRISLFKALAEYAFATGNDYWGWRFMGWGMHYLGDLSMPYHTAPLPGMSAARMIWINLKAIIGFPKSKNDAVQLVSNKHSVLEQYQWIAMREAYSNYDTNPLIEALRAEPPITPYSNDFARNVVSQISVDRSRKVDKALKEFCPPLLVKDPSFEASKSKELDNLMDQINNYSGANGIEQLNALLTEMLRTYSMSLRSYYNAIVSKA
ncbi:MAG: hypothetical protein WBJ36_10110 [Tenuifilum sp.]|uniref:hypothetical protein n=2 Tax=Tenuifilum sp. TaxID=2760880 RepID=UPI003C86AA3E